MTRLTRDQIAIAKDLPEEEIDVPEWGGSVVLRALTMEQMIRVTQGTQKARNQSQDFDVALMILIEAMVEPKLDAGDIEMLRKRNAAVVARLSQKVNNMNGLGDLRVAVESAEGN